jgi:hypothetical protein
MKLTDSDLPYRFNAEGTRHFVLVAGTEHFIETHETTAGISLRPQLVSVSPNPFTDEAEIAFFVPRRMPVRLVVFSVQGRLVDVLTDSRLGAGVHRIVWHGRSSDQSRLAPGIYFLQLDVPGRIETRKMLLVR